MSSKTKPMGAELSQDDAIQTPTADETQTPVLTDGVVKAEKYVFGQYQDGNEYKGKLDIQNLFQPGFDQSAYEFTWTRFNHEDDMPARYFTKVTKATHSRWFKDEAFDKLNGTICRGRGAPGIDPGMAEVTLYVRAKEAANAERAQMLALSAKNRNPNENEQFKAIDQSIRKAIGSDFMRGTGLTQQTRNGWES